MKKHFIFFSMVLFLIHPLPGISGSEKTIHLSTINWEPYTGKSLPDHGFFSELVTEAFSRMGYRVEFRYSSWARALRRARNGEVNGLMNAYWKKERTRDLSYPDVVWKVREEFIVLRNSPLTYTGNLSSLKGFNIGVLRGSLQAEELREAGLQVQEIDNQVQNVKKLLRGRIDAALIPRNTFFYHLARLSPQFDKAKIKILNPPYKTYDMYVVFSRKTYDYEKLTADFNRGMALIKADGSFKKILQKHHVVIEEASAPTLPAKNPSVREASP